MRKNDEGLDEINVWRSELMAKDRLEDIVRKCGSGYGRTRDRQRRHP